MTHKVHYKQTGSRIVTLRNMKNSNRENYIRDLQQQTWANVNLSNDPNEMWDKWKNMLQSFSKVLGQMPQIHITYTQT